MPLKKFLPGSLSLSGLMAGAMSPDLLYFLTMTTVDRGFAHSWPGLFYFCIPAGLLFAFAFHYLFKYHVIVNLPSPLDRKFSGLAASRLRPDSVRQWLILIVSVIIGALTHFAWDSFTHLQGETARMFPYLQGTVAILGHERPITNLLQHGSTLLGFGLLLGYIWRGKILPVPTDLPVRRSAGEKWLFWVGASLFATAFAAVVTWSYTTYFPARLAMPEITFGLAGWAGFFWGVAGYTVVKRLVPARPTAAPVVRDSD